MMYITSVRPPTVQFFASKRPPGDRKVEDAFELGADDVRCIAEGHEQVYDREDGALDKKINVLIVTSNELPDWSKILPLLDRMASIVLMLIQGKPLTMPYMPFILPGHRLISSTEASKRNHVDMLEFVARNSIKPWVKVFPECRWAADGFRQARERKHEIPRGVGLVAMCMVVVSKEEWS